MEESHRPEPTSASPGTARSGQREIVPSPPLPIEGSVEVAMPVGRLWEIFLDVPGWARWNPCIWRASVRGGELREGARLVWAFNPKVAEGPAYRAMRRFWLAHFRYVCRESLAGASSLSG